jgi:hypothetical protein
VKAKASPRSSGDDGANETPGKIRAATPEAAFTLRRSGMPITDIGRALGVTTSEAWDLLEQRQEAAPKLQKDTERALAMERCDLLIRAWLPLATGGRRTDEETGKDVFVPPDAEAAKVLEIYMRQHSKLHGLDAAARIELTGKNGEAVQVLGVDIRSLSDAQLEALRATNDVRSIGEESSEPIRSAAGGAGDGAPPTGSGEGSSEQ